MRFYPLFKKSRVGPDRFEISVPKLPCVPIFMLLSLIWTIQPLNVWTSQALFQLSISPPEPYILFHSQTLPLIGSYMYTFPCISGLPNYANEYNIIPSLPQKCLVADTHIFHEYCCFRSLLILTWVFGSTILYHTIPSKQNKRGYKQHHAFITTAIVYLTHKGTCTPEIHIGYEDCPKYKSLYDESESTE